MLMWTYIVLTSIKISKTSLLLLLEKTLICLCWFCSISTRPIMKLFSNHNTRNPVKMQEVGMLNMWNHTLVHYQFMLCTPFFSCISKMLHNFTSVSYWQFGKGVVVKKLKNKNFYKTAQVLSKIDATEEKNYICRWNSIFALYGGTDENLNEFFFVKRYQSSHHM